MKLGRLIIETIIYYIGILCILQDKRRGNISIVENRLKRTKIFHSQNGNVRVVQIKMACIVDINFRKSNTLLQLLRYIHFSFPRYFAVPYSYALIRNTFKTWQAIYSPIGGAYTWTGIRGALSWQLFQLRFHLKSNSIAEFFPILDPLETWFND